MRIFYEIQLSAPLKKLSLKQLRLLTQPPLRWLLHADGRVEWLRQKPYGHRARHIYY